MNTTTSTTSSTAVQVVVSSDATEIGELVGHGWCPIECSIGGGSIVDDLVMDHHGQYSALESVAVRAYRDHYGVRASDPRFVVAGCVDADASFAIAALAGLLPHPNYDIDGIPAGVADRYRRDLSELAATVARIDTDPIGIQMTSLPGGDILSTWNALHGGGRDTLSAAAGLSLWVTLTTSPAVGAFLEAAAVAEQERFEAATDAMGEYGMVVGPVLEIDGSPVWGFDVWYGRIDGVDPNEPGGWAHPVVVYRNVAGSVTIGCPNTAVAENLFGAGGLRNVFADLQPAGWGGRDTVGGSPRGHRVSDDELVAVVTHLNVVVGR